VSKKKQRKGRRTTRKTPQAPPKRTWRSYALGLLAILAIVLIVAARERLGAASRTTADKHQSAAVSLPLQPVTPAPPASGPLPDPMQSEKPTESAPSTARPIAARPLRVNIPAPKSELERIAQSAALATASRLASGRAATRPDFPLPTLQGLMLGPANYPGRVVLVNFWATWCGPCKKEIPDLMDLYSEYHASGLEVLGVALDGNTDVVRPYAESAGINYAVLVGNPEVGQQYQVTAVPTTVLYDRQGKVAKRLVGYQSRDALEAVIKSLL
jgi:thiol-disulfide isomerase/thioredoxin